MPTLLDERTGCAYEGGLAYNEDRCLWITATSAKYDNVGPTLDSDDCERLVDQWRERKDDADLNLVHRMTELTITLTGEVRESNFEECKDGLVERIHAVDALYRKMTTSVQRTIVSGSFVRRS